MLNLLDQGKIKENWESTYMQQLEETFEATEGGNVFADGSSENYLKGIYSRLMNPFNQTMHLWIDGEEDYLLLTHIQTCEFTARKTLVLFAVTRTNDVDKETIAKRWMDGYFVIAKHAKENQCVGIIGYTDLEYFIEIVKEISASVNQPIITRYQYYTPL
jgi:hypothetical protein